MIDDIFFRIQIITKGDFKTFSMVPDKERTAVYFLARPDNGPRGEGSVFIMDTSRSLGDFSTREMSFLGNRVTTLDVDPNSGNIALSVNSDKDWTLIVMKRLEKPPSVAISVTTEAPTTPTVITTPRSVASFRFADINIDELILESINKIKDVYVNDMMACLSLQRRTDALWKKFARTLQLEDDEAKLIRDSNLPAIIVQSTYEETIEKDVEEILNKIKKSYDVIKNMQ
jgi:hypothetical protein